jgi:hypothetical protein
MLTIVSTALAALAVAAPTHAAAPRIADIDADLRFDGKVHLEAETAGASRVQFTYRGRTYTARKGGFDAEDGTRDWRRTVRARGGDADGGNTVKIKVRACKGGECVTRTERERLELDD